MVVLAVGPLTTIVTRLFGPWFQKLSRSIQNELARATTVAQESLSAIQVTKMFARDRHERNRYASANRDFLTAAIRARKVDSYFNALIAFLTSSSTIAIFWFGGLQVIDGRLTTGALVAFLLYSQNITQSIAGLAQHYSAVSQAAGASSRVFEILDTELEIRDLPGAVDLSAPLLGVSFHDVSFEYAPGVPVLRSVSLDAEPGETVALVGPSGAGKSTLVKLIARLYDVTDGSIEIGGLDLRRYTVRSLRESISIVSQEVVVFGTSIRENIRYGRLDATDDEVEAAARAANAHEFIVQLADGYDTQVGERGIKLSGGQRQRLSIARALLKNAPILILDEATSSIDSGSEALIQQAIDRLKHRRTSFVIAHRQATVRSADKILVLRDGQIVQRGTFAELAAEDGLYRQQILAPSPDSQRVA